LLLAAGALEPALAQQKAPTRPDPPTFVRVRGVSTGNRTVNVSMSDTSFEAPDATTEGMTTFRARSKRATNRPSLLVVRIPAGMLAAEVESAVFAGKLDEMQLSSFGGPGAVSDTAGISEAQIDLRPGRYLLVGQRPGPNGKRVPVKSFTKMLTVANVSRFVIAAPPLVGSTIKLRDHRIELTKELGEGFNVLRVVSEGPQPHELIVRYLLPGKTADDVWQWLATRKGPRPFADAGGVTRLSPNKEAYIRIRLEKGIKYLLSCELADREDGRTHAQHGMYKVITGK
jgi:hypothetical protein